MCGIATIFDYQAGLTQLDQDKMKSGLKLQHHRGPDATGIWSDYHIVMGHNRLSIIDLSTAANQPYSRDDLKLKIAFNGEIYNYKSLKEKLILIGYSFLTESDTEVVLVAYKEFGTEVCRHLVGMFAFIIYDLSDHSMFVAKDRFGEKPLFFIKEGSRYWFASELNTLREIYDKNLEINHEAVIDLVENMYINLHHTIYKNVAVFQPGHSLLVKSNQVSSERYYHVPTLAQNEIPFHELKKEVKSRLYQIVENELNADVPVATFLSSGVDSSLITAISKDIKPEILAITMATHDLHSDESSAAKMFAKALDIKQEIIYVDTDSLNVLSGILKDIQPLADASLIPSFMVTQAVRSKCKVMLSGDGGDEVFGSYNKPNIFLSLKRKGLPLGAGILNSILKSSNPLVESLSKSRLNDYNRLRIGGWSGLYAKHNLNNSFHQKVFKKGRSINQVHQVYEGMKDEFWENPEKISFAVDFFTRLPADFLYKVDSSSMHSSIEVRAPFLDHTLIDFIMEVKTTSLMPNGIDKELTKSILADFTGDMNSGPKKGFSLPYSQFLQNEWGDILEHFLQEKLSESYFEFNYDGILGLLMQHRIKPSQSLARVLFSVLVLEIWLRVFHLKMKTEMIQKSA